MAVRVTAFRAVGGFNERAIAGEEADLAIRLGAEGWSVLKIDEPMAIHDARMLHFAQWWRRTMRAGHAIAHRYIAGGATDFHGRRALRSALFWGCLLPTALLLLAFPTRGVSFVLLLGYAWLGQKVYRHYRATGLSRSDAWLRTRFIIVGKIPEFFGVLRYAVTRLRGRFHVIDWR